jgi:hypothetical protein
MSKILWYASVFLILVIFAVVQEDVQLMNVKGEKPSDTADYSSIQDLNDENLSTWEEILEEDIGLVKDINDVEELLGMMEDIKSPSADEISREQLLRDDLDKKTLPSRETVMGEQNTEEEGLIREMREHLNERREQQREGRDDVDARPRPELVSREKSKTRLSRLTKQRSVLRPISFRRLSEQKRRVIERVIEHEPGEISEDERKEIMLNIENRIKQTERAVDIKRSFVAVEDGTKISVRIVPKKPLYNLSIYEEIPKSVAEDVRDIIFYETNYLVIESDPLIVWYFAELREPAVTSYRVEKLLSDADVGNITSLPVAEKIGINLRTFLPLMVIPVIAMILIYFSRFGLELLPKKKKECKDSGKLVTYIRQAQSRGMDRQQIIAQLKRVGWSGREIESSFKKLR